MEIGECRLCLAKGVELQNSHILPKWTYRRAFDKTAKGGAANPIMMTNEVVIQTSEQATEPMLCFACEQLIGGDERYVADLAYRDGSLGLLGMIPLSSIFKIYAEDLGVFVRGANIAALNCRAIARFAASVFWRAHVAVRPKVQALRLWNPQAESLRLFIRGEAVLPPRMCVNMIAIVDGEAMTSVHSTTTTFPSSGSRGEDGFHQFIAAGLLFNLAMGVHAIPGMCVACSQTPHVIFRTGIGSGSCPTPQPRSCQRVGQGVSHALPRRNGRKTRGWLGVRRHPLQGLGQAHGAERPLCRAVTTDAAHEERSARVVPLGSLHDYTKFLLTGSRGRGVEELR